ncbi:MAG: undecaprenyl/decaprenyl-phosphate alpha-N-acetylglucosaminyl 1-phosphate transferase [Pirellulales bacterium]|nr:undecaprenyl/decaprenyl-phosphate alpha-N-acetylglucosaminyl 1-phosphate transferase [Pirellulales bacterium]
MIVVVAIVLFFSLACVTSLILTALVREVAPYVGLTDRPDGHRKLHGKAMPLGGGVAIFLATVSVLGVVVVQPTLFLQPNPFQHVLIKHWQTASSLVLAGAVIVLVGLVDDRFGLRGWHKLIGQLVAASILVYGGLVIQGIGLFGLEIKLSWLAVPVTLFWLLGAVNSLNLLDGIDGLATMVGIILVATIAAMAGMLEPPRPEVMIIGFVFAGSLVGFMRFNFPPASIYLGDTGSMLIGLVVGALAIQGSLKGPGTVLLAAPLAVWAIPILDSAAAIVRRKLTGRSIYATDRGHLHHRLLSLLGTNRRVLLCLASCCAATSAAALSSVVLRYRWGQSDRADLIALLTVSAIVIIFIATGVFGRAELLLLGNRLRQVGRSIVTPIAGKPPEIQQSSIRLQGSRHWEQHWKAFVKSVEELHLSEIRLDVNLPAAHEGYHASWELRRRDDPQKSWRLDVPLVLTGRPIGGLRIVGRRSGRSVCEQLQRLIELIEPFEKQLLALSAQEVLLPIGDGDDADADRPRGEPVLAQKHPK